MPSVFYTYNPVPFEGLEAKLSEAGLIIKKAPQNDAFIVRDDDSLDTTDEIFVVRSQEYGDAVFMGRCNRIANKISNAIGQMLIDEETWLEMEDDEEDD